MTAVEPCRNTGVCQKCRGTGVHMAESFEQYECEICGGTGECPCIHDHTAHEAPALNPTYTR